MRRLVVVLIAAVCLLAIPTTVHQGQTGTLTLTVQPHLYDPTGHLIFNCGYDGTVSAPQVCENGKVIAVYIDDTTPDLNKWLALAITRYTMVIRAVAPGSRRPKDCRWKHVLCALELYPYESGVPVKDWGRIPRYRAYIIQQAFSFTGRAVKPWQTRKLERQVRRFHPLYVFLY